MKAQNFFRWIGAAAVSLSCATATLMRAQESAEFRPEVVVTVSGEYSAPGPDPLTPEADSRIYVIIDSECLTWNDSGAEGSGLQIPLATKSLQIGREYVVTMDWFDVGSCRLNFGVPDDFTVFLNKLERNQFASSDGTPFTITVFRKSDFAPLPFGATSGLSAGSVVWNVSLGLAHNGKSAGTIALCQRDLDESGIRLASLICDPVSTEVERIPATGDLQQVRSNAGLAVIDPLANGVKISFYPPAQFSDIPPGQTLHPYSGTPLVAYEVTQSTVEWLQIEQTIGAKHWVTDLVKTGGSGEPVSWARGDWHEAGTTSLSLESRFYSGDGYVDESVIVLGPGDVVATNSLNYYADFPWGRELTNVNTPPLSKTLSYFASASAPGNYSRISAAQDVDGRWTRYEYDDSILSRGRVSRVFSPWLDSPATLPGSIPASPADGTLTTFAYGAQEHWNGERSRPTTVQNFTNGIQSGQSIRSLSYVMRDGENVRVESRQDYSNASEHVDSVVEIYEKNTATCYLRDMPHAIKHADGSIEAFAYHRGYYDPWARTFVVSSTGGAWRRVRLLGTSNGSGAQYATEFGEGAHVRDIENLWLVPQQSILEEEMTNATSGNLFRRARWLYLGGSPAQLSSYAPLSGQIYLYTDLGHLQQIWDDARGPLYSSTWANGEKTSETDATGVVTSFTYDVNGRLATRTVAGGPGGPASLTTTYVYDGAGRLLSESRGPDPKIVHSQTFDIGGRVTSRSFPGQSGQVTVNVSYANGGRDVTEIYPDGATQTVSRYLDGQTRSVTGTAVVPAYSQSTVVSDGSIETRVQNSPAPADGPGWRTRNTDWLGRPRLELGATTDSGARFGTHYSWTNGTGQLEWVRPSNQAWTELGAATHFTYDSFGRVSRTWLDVDRNGSLTLNNTDRVTDFEYGYMTDSGQWWSFNKAKIYPQTDSSTALTVSETRSRISFGVAEKTLSETRSIDRFGNVTISKVDFDDANAVSYVRTTHPGSSTVEETEIRGGETMRTRSAQNVTTLFAYDAHHRLTERRRSPSWSDPDQLVLDRFAYYGASDLVSNVGNVNSATYSTHIYAYDNLNRVISDIDAAGGTRFYDYNARGQLAHQWGSAIQPVRYDYDYSGDSVWHQTIRTYQGDGGWTTGSLPWGFSGDGDPTTSTFDAKSGLLTSKTYAVGPAITYAYNNRNELSRRTWARGTYSDYAYTNIVGELQARTSSDGTAEFTKTIARDGQATSVNDVLGAHNFSYNANRQLEHEYLPGALFGSKEIWRVYYESGTSAGGTQYAFALGQSGSPWSGSAGSIVQSNYDYDWSLGRLSGVSRFCTGDDPRSFSYGYKANSNLVETITSGPYQRVHSWDNWRDRSWCASTTWGGGSRGTAVLGGDDKDRHCFETLSGGIESYIGAASPRQIVWWYDDRNQVTGDGVWENGVVQDAKGHGYGYDYAGNRTQLNHATGVSPPVTWYQHDAANTLTGATGTEAATITNDADGNMLSDGTWTYIYDSENRVTSMQRSDLKLEFVYDYVGRRVRKIVSNANGGGGWTFAYERRFIYDGWNLIAELDGNNTTLLTYTWGIDASGTLGGAGGVGGLLMISVPAIGDRWTPIYDGRHNIIGLMNLNGDYIAGYDYDSFGRIRTQTGSGYSGTTVDQHNPFGFETKYTDRETGLVYFGLRYYSPKLGRFINRDPIEEAGGLNLFAFCGNNPVNRYDVLGMWPTWLTNIWNTIFGSGNDSRGSASDGFWSDPIGDYDYDYYYDYFDFYDEGPSMPPPLSRRSNPHWDFRSSPLRDPAARSLRWGRQANAANRTGLEGIPPVYNKMSPEVKAMIDASVRRAAEKHSDETIALGVGVPAGGPPESWPDPREGLPEGDWEWSRDPSNTRGGGKYVDKSQPGREASYSEAPKGAKSPDGVQQQGKPHWKVLEPKVGEDGKRVPGTKPEIHRYDENGKPVSYGEAHPNPKPIPETPWWIQLRNIQPFFIPRGILPEYDRDGRPIVPEA